jgi:hypothetical protein
MARPLPYRFQYQKKLWGVLKNVWRKKMFSAKSMTKLEALTVALQSDALTTQLDIIHDMTSESNASLAKQSFN